MEQIPDETETVKLNSTVSSLMTFNKLSQVGRLDESQRNISRLPIERGQNSARGVSGAKWQLFFRDQCVDQEGLPPLETVISSRNSQKWKMKASCHRLTQKHRAGDLNGSSTWPGFVEPSQSKYIVHSSFLSFYSCLCFLQLKETCAPIAKRKHPLLLLINFMTNDDFEEDPPYY
ncbi:unnamed protein product [Leuciscus chuanchicus]